MEQVTKGYKLKRVRNLGKNPDHSMDQMRNFQTSLKPWEEIAEMCKNREARILYRCLLPFYFFAGEHEENTDTSILLFSKPVKKYKNTKIHVFLKKFFSVSYVISELKKNKLCLL